MRKLLLILLIVMIYVVANGISLVDRVLNQEDSQQKDEVINEDPSYTWTDDTLQYQPHEQTIQKPDEEEIIQKYENTFETLKEETIDEIENIKEEVLANLDEDPNPIKLGALVLKYEQKATALENEIDKKFTNFFESYKEEMNRYGYSTSSVNKLERTYKRTKSKLKRDLVKEASAWMEGRSF